MNGAFSRSSASTCANLFAQTGSHGGVDGLPIPGAEGILQREDELGRVPREKLVQDASRRPVVRQELGEGGGDGKSAIVLLDDLQVDGPRLHEAELDLTTFHEGETEVERCDATRMADPDRNRHFYVGACDNVAAGSGPCDVFRPGAGRNRK